MRHPRGRILLLLLLCSCIAGGCVRRTLAVKSDPPGALVFLNDVEVGRTPIERDFVFYGTYDVQVRKEGYDTIKAHSKVIAPWWQWVPIDFFTEFLPLHDHHVLTYTLRPTSETAVDPQLMLSRAEEFGKHLQSSGHTRAPATTTWTTRPSTHRSHTTAPVAP